MPFKSIPLWRVQKYKKWVTPDFDIPDILAVTPTPSRPPAMMAREQRNGRQRGAWRGNHLHAVVLKKNCCVSLGYLKKSYFCRLIITLCDVK